MSSLIVLEGSRTIQLPSGHNTLIDQEDWERIKDCKFHLCTNRDHAYVRVNTPNQPRYQYLHRKIMEAPKSIVIDHRNGDDLDNRKDNLRQCTNTENLRNQRKTCGSSQFKGVCWDKRAKRWVSGIVVNRKRINLGYFTDEREAARSYDFMAIELFGEFACTNAELFGDDLNQN